MVQKKGDIIVGLDIGTTKICCIVGEVTPEGIDVIGIGTHPSRGLRKGVVINIEATVKLAPAGVAILCLAKVGSPSTLADARVPPSR